MYTVDYVVNKHKLQHKLHSTNYKEKLNTSAKLLGLWHKTTNAYQI